VIEDALPADLYAELAASFPSAEAVAGRPDLPGNTVFRRSAHEVVDDPGTPRVWRDFFAYHTSPAFFAEVVRLWRAEIGRRFPTFEREFGKPPERFSVGLRRPGKRGNPLNRERDVVLDCQFSVNSAVRERGTVCGPHLDSPHKLFAGLFYRRDPRDRAEGGDLAFYRLKRGRYPRPRPSRIDLRGLEVVETVPYRANTLVMFLNTPLSIHGVTPRAVTEVPRRYVNLLGECYAGKSDDYFTTPDPLLPRWWRKALARVRRYV
jgi:hypothetical protein